MKYKVCSIDQVKTVRQNASMIAILEQFVNEGVQCAVIDDYPHKSANTLATSLRKAALRERLYHVKILVRKDKVYMVNELISKKND